MANAVLRAAERGLNLGAEHAALVESFWSLTQLPTGARGKLRCRPAEAVDARLPNNAGRTDLGEMAQAAASEAVVRAVTERTQSLFTSTSDDVQAGPAGLATVKQFGPFARQFYARLTEKVLQYYVSRTTANEVGEGLRFATLAGKAAFDQALSLHCKEASKIVEKFAGEWFDKFNWEQKGITREHARGFAHIALRKMTDELKAGAK